MELGLKELKTEMFWQPAAMMASAPMAAIDLVRERGRRFGGAIAGIDQVTCWNSQVGDYVAAINC